MTLLDLLIAPAYAQAATQPAPGGLFGGGILGFLPMILIFGAVYFLMIRPQTRRAKEHRAMLDRLGTGDEVITNGGIAGTVRELGDSFVTVEIADNVRVRLQKGAIATVLPKGTLKSA
ncbi:MAG: yajC [Xanthomonadaceae bacterium]|nr:yajC [Xanthomonadaceae bacterium]